MVAQNNDDGHHPHAIDFNASPWRQIDGQRGSAASSLRLRIAGESGTTHVPAVTNEGLFHGVEVGATAYDRSHRSGAENRDRKHWQARGEDTYDEKKASHFHKQVHL